MQAVGGQDAWESGLCKRATWRLPAPLDCLLVTAGQRHTLRHAAQHTLRLLVGRLESVEGSSDALRSQLSPQLRRPTARSAKH